MNGKLPRSLLYRTQLDEIYLRKSSKLYSWFIPHPGLLTLLPVLLTAALLFGALTGWLAGRIHDRLPAAST